MLALIFLQTHYIFWWLVFLLPGNRALKEKQNAEAWVVWPQRVLPGMVMHGPWVQEASAWIWALRLTLWFLASACAAMELHLATESSLSQVLCPQGPLPGPPVPSSHAYCPHPAGKKHRAS
jgi:hypothetical protein